MRNTEAIFMYIIGIACFSVLIIPWVFAIPTAPEPFPSVTMTLIGFVYVALILACVVSWWEREEVKKRLAE